VEDESLVPLKLQLSGTPTFFVNGVKTDLAQLEKVVKTALEK
jgi:protein-disulfide isomerase